MLVWSSGYIAGPYGVDQMAPITLVAWRFGLAAVLAAALAWVLRGRPVLHLDVVLRIGLVGFVMNGLQFGAMYLAFDAGLGATLGALMHSLSPVLTALLAALLLRERLSRTQVVGFVVGVAGVLLVLGPDVDAAGGLAGLTFGVVGTLALSFGTLGQRWIGRAPDPLWSAAIQFAASAPPLWVLGLALEGTDVVENPGGAALALVYLAVVNSIVGLFLLGTLVRAGGAGAAVQRLLPHAAGHRGDGVADPRRDPRRPGDPRPGGRRDRGRGGYRGGLHPGPGPGRRADDRTAGVFPPPGAV